VIEADGAPIERRRQLGGGRLAEGRRGQNPADVLTPVALVCSPGLFERAGDGRERYLTRKTFSHECAILSIRVAGVAALTRGRAPFVGQSLASFKARRLGRQGEVFHRCKGRRHQQRCNANCG
jgi:hypothetical protein